MMKKEQKIICYHKNIEALKSFRLNYSHGKKGSSVAYGLPKSVSIKCRQCKKILKRYKIKKFPPFRRIM